MLIRVNSQVIGHKNSIYEPTRTLRLVKVKASVDDIDLIS